MHVTLQFEERMRLTGRNAEGHETVFDTTDADGNPPKAASPLEVMLQSVAACSGLDILYIIRKRRKTITDLRIAATGERAETHPRYFTSVHLTYTLVSPDASAADLDRAIELSMETYCSASALFQKAGVKMTWDAHLERP